VVESGSGTHISARRETQQVSFVMATQSERSMLATVTSLVVSPNEAVPKRRVSQRLSKVPLGPRFIRSTGGKQ